MKSVLAGAAVAVGSVGMAGSLLAAIFVWPLSDEYTARTEKVTQSADEILTAVNDALDRVDQGIGKTQGQIDRLRLAAQDVALGSDEGDPVVRAKFETLVADLSAKLAEAEGMTLKLEGAAMTLRQFAEFAAALTFNTEQAEQLEFTTDILGRTSAALNGIQRMLAQLRQNQDPKTIARDVAAVVANVQPMLTALRQRVDEVNASVTHARGEVAALEQGIAFWRANGPTLFTGLMIWIGVGQWALTRWGWQRMRRTAVAVDLARIAPSR